MPTDVHQQRQAARPFVGRRCMNCGVRLYEGECARLIEGSWKRVDVCLQCDTNGAPRRPEGRPHG